MSVSIDGKIHKTNLFIKYGQEFPKEYSNRKLYISSIGDVMVYIIDAGTPEWTEKMTVKIPIKFYVTQILDDSKAKKPNKNLRLVKS